MKLKGRYNVYSHLYKFEQYGIPQKRHRYIIVGIRSDFDFIYNPPAPTTPLEKQFVNCQKAIEGIVAGTPNHDYYKSSSTVIERLKNIKPGFNAFNSDIPKSLQLK